MRYGFTLNGGDNFRQLVEFAVDAEAAGWDGFFLPDAIAIETKQFPALPFFDPWVLLGAMAIRTERIRLGTFLTALPRRRPWKLAREVVTLDHLSQGRAILAVGLGAAEDDGGFYKVGEEMDIRIRAQRLDEGLEILAGLWQGKPFSFTGEHYNLDQMTQLPPPVQKPRVPIWVPGVWPKPKSIDRTIRWDGIIPQAARLKPETVAQIRQYVLERRATKDPFDIIVGGSTPGAVKDRKKAAAKVRPFADAGTTWWIESLWSGDVRKRIQQGPPRLD